MKTIINEILEERIFCRSELLDILKLRFDDNNTVTEFADTIQEIRSLSYDLAEKTHDKNLSTRKARRILLSEYPYLNSSTVDILLSQVLFESR